MPSHPKRRLLTVFTVFTIVMVGGFATWQLAIRSLKSQVEQALGPQGEVREIRVGLTGIEILDIRIRAQKNSGWPSEDELRAKRIVATPDLLDLLTARLSIDSIRIEDAYISMLHTRNGQMKIIPSLLEMQTVPAGKPAPDQARKPADGKPDTQTSIGNILLTGGVIEFYDASIRSTPIKLRLEQIDASIGKLLLPDLTGHTAIKIEGILKGNRQDGKLAIDGSIELATNASGFSTKLRGIDMTVLQPYLIQSAETGVRRGTLDLDLKSSVTKGKLRAPGTLTLADLELASSSGAFMGLPRSAAIGMMKDKKGRLSVKFVLEGDINDPKFSLNEQMATRLGSSLATTLGISLESLAKGVSGVGSGSAKGIGESVQKLLRK